jgi:alpha-1,6-mannosyltransferase
LTELAWPTVPSRPVGVALRRATGVGGLALTVASGALIALGSASTGSGVVAGRRALSGALQSPLQDLAWPLTHNRFLILLLLMAAGYAFATLGAGGLRLQWVVPVIVVLHVLFALAPPLLSTDVFSYVNYARLGAVHGLNPYVHVPADAPQDPSFALTGERWRFTPSTYGPLFTLLGYPLAWLGVAASMWGEKALAAAAGLVCVAAVAGCARAIGRDPLPAVLLVGLNPVFLVYGVGGAHNDLLMLAVAMGGVLLVLRDRDAAGAAGVVAAAAVKTTAIVALPMLLAARRARWPALVAGAAAAGAVCGLADIAAFGTAGAHLLTVLGQQQSMVAFDGFPNRVAHLVGLRGVFPVDRLLLRIAVAIVLLGLVYATWRGIVDWVSASGWGLLALLLASTWTQAWYLLWPLPFAAVARDRRLVAAVLLAQGLFLLPQLGPLLA